MRTITASEITQAVSTLCIEACCNLPQDVVAALQAAYDREEKPSAKAVMEQLLENQALARSCHRPCCQDTGLAIVFADIGQDVHIEGDFEQAVNAGVSKGYTEGYLRKSSLTALTRNNTGDNTPAIIHVRLVKGDRIHLTLAPKGFGSENMSRLFMLKPAQGIAGVEESIVQAVRDAGSNACPPVVVGVGIGGTMEAAALLAKRQLLRPLGTPSQVPMLRELEEKVLARINALGIGPMGLGGKTTALAVHIDEIHTHLAGLPVAVNMQCHACRHAEVTL